LIPLNGSTTFQEIAEKVSKYSHALWRSDGTKFHGGYIKALKGTLSSSIVFIEQGPNSWRINETQSQLYEARRKDKNYATKISEPKFKDGILTNFDQSTETAEKHENNETGNKNGNSKRIGKLTNSKD